MPERYGKKVGGSQLVLKVIDTMNTEQTKPYTTSIPHQFKNNVIDGYFVLEKNEEELLISRVNAILCVFIAVLIAVMLASYYIVTIKEIQLNKIHKSIITNRDENVDLQNKLDSLTSYTHVDKVTRQKNLLQKSQQIIEVKATDTPIENATKDTHKPSFKWSVGY